MAEEKKVAPAGTAAGKVRSTRNKKLPRDKYALKNLKFLGDFMTSMGLTTARAAEKAGLSHVGVYYWLKKDDGHLSSVERLINACGYDLVFELLSDDPDEVETTIVRKSTSKRRRLAFLEKDILDYGIEKLAGDFDMSAAGIYYWLSQDDIFISYIYRIAGFLGKKVKVSIIAR